MSAVLCRIVLICVTMLSLTPIEDSYSQVLSRSRSSGDEKHNGNTPKTSQRGNDSVPIPWHSLDEHSTKLIRDVLDGKTFFRQMPQQLGYCDAEMYDFLICHPDVVVELWELLGVTQISLTETGPNKYLLKEGTTTTSRIEVLYKSKNLCVVYASGEYDAPVLLRKIKGDVILLLKSRYGRDKENRPVVQCDLDAYVRIHNPGAEMLAKILIPVVGKIADSNFEQAVRFVMNVSEAAQEDYEPLAGLAQRMENVRPEVAEGFASVSEAVFDREVDRFIALADDSPKTVAELEHPATRSATEASAMPKYAQQPDARQPEQIVAPQKATFETLATNDSRLGDSRATSGDLDSRLAPLSAGEIQRDMMQNRHFTTAGTAVQSAEPSESVAPDVPTMPPRRLTITNDGRSIHQEAAGTNEQPASDRQQRANVPIMASVPAFGQAQRNDQRAQTMAPSEKEIASRDAVTRNRVTSNPSTASNNDRVLIRTISPSQSMMVVRSASQYQASTLAPAPAPGIIEQTPSLPSGVAPSPQLGVTTPSAPQPAKMPNSQYPDNKLPLPVYLPK